MLRGSCGAAEVEREAAQMGVMVSWSELLDDMDAGTQFPLYWCFLLAQTHKY